MMFHYIICKARRVNGIHRQSVLRWLACAGVFLWLSCSFNLFAQPTSQQLYLQCLTNFETYAQSIWHASSTIPDAGYWGDGGSTGNGGIRGNSGIAVAYAVLCVALPSDSKYSTRLTYLRQALNYDYNTHITGNYNTVSGNKWGWSNGSLATCTSQGGSDWQTAEWSGSMGLACLLMQSNLPAATVSGVQTAVASEANHRATIPPCTRILSSGDTKAEENAWDGNIVTLAAAWMTNNPNASNWLYSAKSYLANTYTVAYPDLMTPDTISDPLASWVSTVTIFPSYALENHGFYHPTYEMVAAMSAGDSLLVARLADTHTATQLQPFDEHNVMAVWTNNLDTLVTATGDFAYPSGVDWSVRDFEHNSFMAWMAAHFNDPIARWADNQLAKCVRYRQVVNGDGTFVGISANPGGGILFYREAVEARRTAIAWLHWSLADFPTGPMTAPASTLMNNTDVQVIHQRSPFGTFSVSYNGARVMANVDAVALSSPTNTFISSPRLPGILGLGALGNPASASLISYATNTSGGFDAELKITSSLGTTEDYIKSTSASVALLEVPTLNGGAAASSGGSFFCGIENDPLTGGSRLLEWANNSVTINALSGTAVNISNNWICVSGRYGLTAGPAGYFNYAANTTYTRTDSAGYSESGEAEDALSFVEKNQLAPRYAVWFPAQNAVQTSNLVAQVSWNISGSNATLTFPGSGGLEQLSALVPPASTASSYPPYELGVRSVQASSSQGSYPPTNAVDNNTSTFWVSSGTEAGQGPTPSHPEWLLVNFPRLSAVSEFQVIPRTVNGGYGPANLQLWLNDVPVTTNTMTGTGILDVKFSPPLDATNAELYITGSYDQGNSSNPENVQVLEFDLFERAPPGTFADWQLNNFTDLQLTNPAIGTAAADPDGDGVPNLLEFAVDGNPWVADATNAVVAGSQAGGQFFFQFQERNALGNVGRQFQSSGDLFNWSNTTPISVSVLQKLGLSSLYEAIFPVFMNQQFLRISYSVAN
jgi:hypothetical protein